MEQLLEKVKAGEEMTYLDFAIRGTGAEPFIAARACRGSIDAAIALGNSLLPKTKWALSPASEDMMAATIWRGRKKLAFAVDDNPARALLIAILQALVAK